MTGSQPYRTTTPPDGTGPSEQVEHAESKPLALVKNLKRCAPLCRGSSFDGWLYWPCERRTRNANGYCWQHQAQAPRRRP